MYDVCYILFLLFPALTVQDAILVSYKNIINWTYLALSSTYRPIQLSCGHVFKIALLITLQHQLEVGA